MKVTFGGPVRSKGHDPRMARLAKTTGLMWPTREPNVKFAR
jgi:hypothetical protein